MARTGRPKIKRKNAPKRVIDYSKVGDLVLAHFKMKKIAEYFGVSLSTLEKDVEFLRVYKQKKADDRINFFKDQRDLSKINAAISIWLGKNYYDQSDSKVEIDNKQIDNLEFIL